MVVEGWQACAERNARERAIADQLGSAPNFRLACQTVVTGDVTIRRLVFDERDVELADVRLRSPRRHRRQRGLVHRRARWPTTRPIDR